jgi:hypothetical protein
MYIMKMMAHQEVKIVTTFRCICRKRLVLKEVQRLNIMLFGCNKCQCFLIITPNRLKEYVYLRRFSWQRFMKDLYASYLEARKYICK